MCPPGWSPLPGCAVSPQVIVNRNLFTQYAHSVLPSTPRRCHLHHGRVQLVLHQLPGQTVHPALVPRGWSVGPSSWAWALLCGPKVPAGLLSTPLAPFSSSCCCLCLGHPRSLLDSNATHLCFSLSPTLLGRLCGGRKNPGLEESNRIQPKPPALPFSWAGRS